jgi:serine/threonine protein kinase
VVDANPHADPPWMVTAYIDGPSLQEAVSRYGPLPPDRVRALGAGLAEGLGAIQARGLVHRDLKPGNVIMAADGPRIIDFGIARAMDATSGITSTGVVVGTFAYMSPEQLRGDGAGAASDVFALGGVLGFAATGRPPFGTDPAATVMFRIISEPPDLAGLADGGLRELIGRCLDKTPTARPAVSALLTALSSPDPVLVHTGGPAPAAPAAAAFGTPTQTRAPAPPPTGPGPEALPPLPATGALRPFPGAPGSLPPPGRVQTGRPPAPPGRAAHGRPSRGRSRWLGALIAVVVLAVALAIALPALLTRATPKPGAGAGASASISISISSAGTTPARSSPSPATSRSRTPDSTPSSTNPATSSSQATGPSPAPSASSTPSAHSAGPTLISVPNVVDDSPAKATQVLEAAGFKVRVSEAPIGGNMVYDYSPVTPQPRGTTIVIDVSP